MKTNNSYIRIKRYPELTIVPDDHPLNNNLKLVYSDMYGGNIKLDSRPNNINRKLNVSIKEKTDTNGKKLNKIPVKENPSNENVSIIRPKENEYLGYSKFEDKGILTLEACRSLVIPDSSFLIENIIVAESLNVLAGEGGTGKSSLLSQIGISICCKKNAFLGYTINAKYNRVIYISTEDGKNQIKKRTDKQTSLINYNKDWFTSFAFIPFRQGALRLVKTMLSDLPADLVVIDNFNDLFEDDLNSSIAVRKFFNQLQDLIDTYHCAVVVLTHVTKTQMQRSANKTGILGSGAMTDKPRHVLVLNKNQQEPEYRTLNISKSNYISDEVQKTPIELKFNSETLTFKKAEVTYKVGEDIPKQKQTKKGRKRDPELVATARKLRNEGYKLEAIAKVVGKDKSTVSRWLKKFGFDPSSVGPVP